MRWWGKWIFFVSLDFSETAEQLNFSEASLHVTGNFSLVKEEMVQFVDIHDLFRGQDSVINILSVNVWNRASEAGLAEAFMEWWAQHVLPTMWISWLNNSAAFDRTPSWGISRYLVLSPEAG